MTPYVYYKYNAPVLYRTELNHVRAVTLILCLTISVISSFFIVFTEAVPQLPVPYPCAPGYALEPNGSCTICPPGTATDNPLWGCDKCPPGTVTPFKGVTSVSLCQPCARHSAAVNGATECERCPVGEVAIGRGRCLNCPKGRRITPSGRCERCDYFSISTLANTLHCTPCPNGLLPDRTRTVCIRRNCPIGSTWTPVERHGTYSARCRPCPPNSVRPKAAPACVPCGPYEVVLPARKARKCVRCRPGTYVSGVEQPMVRPSPEAWVTPEPTPGFLGGGGAGYYSDTDDVRSCIPCAANTTTFGFSKPTCRDFNQPCPPDTFEDADGDCMYCVRNMRRSLSQNTCVHCPARHVSPGGTSSECRSCPPNSVVLNGRCDCAAGYVFQSGECVACPSGTYRKPEENPLFSDNACLSCPSSTFSNPAAAACTPCPDGWTSAGTNGHKCVKLPECKPGFVVPNDDLEMWAQVPACVSAVSGCPEGLVNAGVWGTTSCYDEVAQQFVCAPGWLATNSLTGAACLKCEFGVASFETVSGTWVCAECEWDEVRIGGVYGACKKCDDGFIPDPSGAPICVCPDGWYIESGKCFPCPFSVPFESLPTACLFHLLP